MNHDAIPQDQKQEEGISTGSKVVIGSLITIFILIVIGAFVYQYRKKSRHDSQAFMDQDSLAAKGDNENSLDSTPGR